MNKPLHENCLSFVIFYVQHKHYFISYLQVSLKKESFIIHDSGVGDLNRILVSATQRNLNLLSRSKVPFMDGMFKVTPSIFFQVYTVHVMYKDAVVPLVYTLLPNKTEETYQR